MPGQEERFKGHATEGTVHPKDVFISHSSTDAELAQRICARLENQGISCWIAPRDIRVADRYALECLRGVAETEALILLASEKALGSVQVLSEIEQAHKRAHPIYTILIPPARVQGEVDFYISRLHWLQGGGRTPEDLADTLASVIVRREGRKEAWEELASPPTMSRTMRYRPVAFAKLVAAATLSLVTLVGGLAYAVNRILDTDFRRLGYVTLSGRSTNGGALEAHAQVWLMAQGVAFRDARLRVAASGSNDGRQEYDAPPWPVPDQIGSMQEEVIRMQPDVTRFTTCLTVPSPGLHAAYRVTQQFAVGRSGSEIEIAEIAEKSVNREDGSPCRLPR